MKLKKMLVLLFSMVLMLVVMSHVVKMKAVQTDKKDDTPDKVEEKATPKISIMTKLHTAEVPDDKLTKLA